MEEIVTGNHARLAAVIVEPLCQGAAGMRLYPEEYLRRLRALCNRFSILLIADEIAVGFGRTGHMFACDRAGISPDLMCLGKGLTGGTLPMSATLVTAEIYDSFRSTPEKDRTFYHGHTYCGNPITSAAALAAIDVYIDDNVIEKSEPSAAVLAAGFDKFRSLDTVADAASLHMIGALEVTPAAGGAAFARAVALKALDLGLQIRPLGPVIYVFPPLITPPETVREMIDLLETALRETPAP
jgi:adenosylmethionine-8-amino-7-oxononanoate aminotransferase